MAPTAPSIYSDEYPLSRTHNKGDQAITHSLKTTGLCHTPCHDRLRLSPLPDQHNLMPILSFTAIPLVRKHPEPFILPESSCFPGF